MDNSRCNEMGMIWQCLNKEQKFAAGKLASQFYWTWSVGLSALGLGFNLGLVTSALVSPETVLNAAARLLF